MADRKERRVMDLGGMKESVVSSEADFHVYFPNHAYSCVEVVIPFQPRHCTSLGIAGPLATSITSEEGSHIHLRLGIDVPLPVVGW